MNVPSFSLERRTVPVASSTSMQAKRRRMHGPQLWSMALGLVAMFALSLGMTAHAAPQAAGETTFGGTIFLDATHIEHAELGQHDADASGYGVDLKRFYLDFGHGFSDVWSLHVTTDIQWKRHGDPTDLWLKKAYLQGKFSKALVLRMGAASTPWMSWISKWYGYRYVEKGVVARAKAGSAADWGVFASGKFGPAASLSYAAAVITGAGYKKPRIGDGPDVTAQLGWQPMKDMMVAVGGYQGKVGDHVEGVPDWHTAKRWNVLVAWANEHFRLGGQYFHARNWHRVTQPVGDTSHGWSAWVSMQVSPRFAVFARHDRFDPSNDLDPDRRDRYSNLGLEWKAAKWLKLAAVYKHGRLDRGPTDLESDNEIGIWSQIKF